MNVDAGHINIHDACSAFNSLCPVANPLAAERLAQPTQFALLLILRLISHLQPSTSTTRSRYVPFDSFASRRLQMCSVYLLFL